MLRDVELSLRLTLVRRCDRKGNSTVKLDLKKLTDRIQTVAKSLKCATCSLLSALLHHRLQSDFVMLFLLVSILILTEWQADGQEISQIRTRQLEIVS